VSQAIRWTPVPFMSEVPRLERVNQTPQKMGHARPMPTPAAVLMS
jgi:hypothetical protein